MILPENIDLEVFVFQSPAVEEWTKLGGEGHGYRDDRGEMGGLGFVVASFDEFSDGEGY